MGIVIGTACDPISGAPLIGPDGRVEEWVELCEDITQRKRGEQLLALEHLVSRSLADADDAATALKRKRDGTKMHARGCGIFTFADGRIKVKNAFRKQRP